MTFTNTTALIHKIHCIVTYGSKTSEEVKIEPHESQVMRIDKLTVMSAIDEVSQVTSCELKKITRLLSERKAQRHVGPPVRSEDRLSLPVVTAATWLIC